MTRMSERLLNFIVFYTIPAASAGTLLYFDKTMTEPPKVNEARRERWKRNCAEHERIATELEAQQRERSATEQMINKPPWSSS